MTLVHPAFAPLDAPTLVEASAGTGKTYTITTYFVRAIVEQGLSPKDILIVTYTRAATSELRARARERIVDALARLEGRGGEPDVLDEIIAQASEYHGRAELERRLRNALGSMDQAAIFTIHGFCQRLLQDHPLVFGIDFDFEVAEDRSSLHAELASDFWASDLHRQPEWLVRALADQTVTTKHLTEIANKCAMPGVEIVGPEPIEMNDRLMDRALEAKRSAASVWFEQREQVAAILRDDPGLHRNRYPKKSMPTWGSQLDDYFAKDGLVGAPDFLPKLAAGEMSVKNGQTEPEHPFFDACATLVEAQVQVQPMLDYAVFAFKMRFLSHVESERTARTARTGALSYDDLLSVVHRSLTGGAAATRQSAAATIASEYPLALVDEFQDTDSVQYAIFRSIYGEGSAVYVGDPKQAIYSFRGADLFSYIEAANDVADRRYSLDTNRRSDPSIVRAVNTLFETRTPAFGLDAIRFQPAKAHHADDRATIEPAMEVLFVGKDDLDGRSVSELVAQEVAGLLRSGTTIEGRAIAPDDVAILCRSNDKARLVTEALRDLRIPTSLDGESSVLETKVAGSLQAVLEAALMPGDARTVRRALLTPLLGVCASEIASMPDDEWTLWVSRFQSWHDTWRSQGVARLLEGMLHESGAAGRLAAGPAPRRELTDLLHLEELLMRGERERHRDPVALMQWYRRLGQSGSGDGLGGSEQLQQRPDAESGAVRVTTIHKSKGLEYGFVFCPFPWGDAGLRGSDSAILKYHEDDGAIRVDLGSPEHAAHRDKAEHEALSESLRVLYVAVTRAKHRCTLFWGRRTNWRKSALGYLLHGETPSAKTSEDEMLAAVEALAKRSEGTIGWRAPEPGTSEPFEQVQPVTTLAARKSTRGFDLSARIASFTSLTGQQEKAPGPRPSSDDEPRSELFSFLPGGTRTGLLLHSILERVGMDSVAGDPAKAQIERELRTHGFSDALAEPVQSDLLTASSTPLFDTPDCPGLAGLDPDRQLRELEFTLSASRSRLDDLVEILREHAAPSSAPEYVDRLAGLGAQSLQSFLRGYIDLMFEWQGRWYVADYKSNTLPGYGPQRVREAVQREHYVLQGLLYSAAAQRYLRHRVPAYDAGKHWGGALFLFLRGMKGAETPGASVFFDRQTPELLVAIDDWLGGSNDLG